MTPKVLIVDDEESIRTLYARHLKRLGCWCVLAANVSQARSRLQEHVFDLALIDVNMPGESGLDLVQYISRHYPNTASLMVTAVDDPLVADSALEVGAYGYLVKPFEGNELLINASNALRRRRLEIQNQEQRDRLEHLLLGGAKGVSEGLTRLKKLDEEGQAVDDQLILEIARAAEFHDTEPGQHIERMSHYCYLLAEGIGQDSHGCELIRRASMLHDVGKVVIPDSILFKTARLTPYEFDVVKRHASFGHHMLMGSGGELMQLAASIAWCHHERFDGTGYPRGLAGDSIPLEGRIAAIADAFDALTSPSIYRPAYTLDKALATLHDGRGKNFDPILLDTLLSSSRTFEVVERSQVPEPCHEGTGANR